MIETIAKLSRNGKLLDIKKPMFSILQITVEDDKAENREFHPFMQVSLSWTVNIFLVIDSCLLYEDTIGD